MNTLRLLATAFLCPTNDEDFYLQRSGTEI